MTQNHPKFFSLYNNFHTCSFIEYLQYTYNWLHNYSHVAQSVHHSRETRYIVACRRSYTRASDSQYVAHSRNHLQASFVVRVTR